MYLGQIRSSDEASYLLVFHIILSVSNSISVWSIHKSVSHPHNGVTEHAWLMFVLHLGQWSSLHFVLKEIKKLNFKVGVQFCLLEDVELLNNLVKGLDLELIFNGVGFNVLSQKSNNS